MKERVEISKRLTAINSASSLGARILNVSVLVWMNQYLLAHISDAEYSLYPVLISVIAFAPLLTMILTSGLGRYTVEAYARGDEDRVRQIVSTMFPLLLAAGLVLLTGGCTFAWYVDRVLSIPPERLWDARIMMALLVLSLAARLPAAPFSVGMYIRQKFVIWNSIDVVAELFRLALLLVLLLGVSPRIIWVVVAEVTAQLVRLFVRLAVSRRLVPALRFSFHDIRWSAARQVTGFGAWNFVMGVADMIRSAADPIILNKLAMPFDVVVFHLGSIPLRQIKEGAGIVRHPLQPAITAMHAIGSNKRLRNAYLRGGRLALWVSMCMVAPLIVYRFELFTLYVGSEYRVAGTVMLLLLMLFPVQFGNLMMSEVAHARGQLRGWSLRLLVMHLVNLGLTFYLVGVRGMGAVGSALATFLVLTIGDPILNWPLGFKLAGVDLRSWLRRTYWPGMMPALASLPVWFILRYIFQPDTWASLGLCTGLGFLFYMAVTIAFAFQPEDRADMQAVAAKVFSIFKRSVSSAKI